LAQFVAPSSQAEFSLFAPVLMLWSGMDWYPFSGVCTTLPLHRELEPKASPTGGYNPRRKPSPLF
jgi:hypothetical protein